MINEKKEYDASGTKEFDRFVDLFNMLKTKLEAGQSFLNFYSLGWHSSTWAWLSSRWPSATAFTGAFAPKDPLF